jgi:hypothetical protein
MEKYSMIENIILKSRKIDRSAIPGSMNHRGLSEKRATDE